MPIGYTLASLTATSISCSSSIYNFILFFFIYIFYRMKRNCTHLRPHLNLLFVYSHFYSFFLFRSEMESLKKFAYRKWRFLSSFFLLSSLLLLQPYCVLNTWKPAFFLHITPNTTTNKCKIKFKNNLHMQKYNKSSLNM